MHSVFDRYLRLDCQSAMLLSIELANLFHPLDGAAYQIILTEIITHGLIPDDNSAWISSQWHRFFTTNALHDSGVHMPAVKSHVWLRQRFCTVRCTPTNGTSSARHDTLVNKSISQFSVKCADWYQECCRELVISTCRYSWSHVAYHAWLASGLSPQASHPWK